MGTTDGPATAEAVPRQDRFDWFCETVTNDLLPVSVSSAHTADFHAAIQDVELGAVRLSSFAFSPVRARRTAAHVRQGDPEQYQLILVTRGRYRTSQRGNESSFENGLVLFDTSRPNENVTDSADGPVHAIMLQIPHSALAIRPERLDRLLARGIPADRGPAAILAGHLRSLLAHGPECTPADRAAMGSVVVDLATTCLARQLGTPEAAPAEARAQEMLHRVTRFIDHNLGDPDLTPRAVAEHHNMSLRALYGLFRDQPESVAARIRQGRLARAREELTRPELLGQPVQAIAARWGFSSATVFSRAFRQAYGITPTEQREAVAHRP
ncbi:helix-turn-helix domain-containing protein [Streptomyces sp. NPDC127092]|uniref:AraC-like ligand-binding domain-containing protein n=1 Tax=Streptomyces sp. NPDC127092 TaxID=3347135 RepID=UPI003656903B